MAKGAVAKGAPNQRTYLPYYGEGKRQVLNTIQIEDPDDLESELKQSNTSGQPIRSGNVFRYVNIKV